MYPTQPASLSLPLPHLAEHYLLDPDITFLNHGSFGACPRPVFAAYQGWQREIEANPVHFIGRRLPQLLKQARERLGGYLGAHADELVFVPNATHGINIVARSLKLGPGDEVLATDHEYGAVNNTWRFLCEKSGARYINQPVPTPIISPEAMVEALWAGVTERTRVIAISHVTSPTAVTFPVGLICQRARAAGIITVIDGAHAPGQLDLQLDELGADFYTGNCHKWLSSARGAAFLYARRDQQDLLEPLVVSHGWSRQDAGQTRFLNYFTWTGTDDPSAYLSVPAAIDFQEQHNWPAVRAACHSLALEAHHRILELGEYEPFCPESMWTQMVSTPLPGRAEDYQELWDQYQIVAPIGERHGQAYIRLSIQAYNKPGDIDHTLEALGAIIRDKEIATNAGQR